MTFIDNLPKKDYFLPINLSTADLKEAARNHPIDRYEQILIDLLIKGTFDGTSREKRSFNNYLNQLSGICRKCTTGDNVDYVCDNCRVDALQWSIDYLVNDLKELNDLILEDKKDYIRKLRKVIKRLKRNRWNWKKKALKYKLRLDNLPKVMFGNDK